jgi:hypothetical protein
MNVKKLRANTVWRLFRTVGIGVLLIAGSAPLSAQDVASVARSPTRYQNKRIDLVGILRGEQGPEFELYSNRKEALSMTPHNAIRLKMANNWKKSAQAYDLRRVRITGVVDASKWRARGNACSISVETLEIISGPVANWPDIAVVLKNEGGAAVSVSLRNGPFSHVFELLPGEVENKYVKGQGTLTVSSRDGKVIASLTMIAEPRTSYYDPVNSAFYYRVIKNTIEKVLPASAAHWGWKR